MEQANVTKLPTKPARGVRVRKSTASELAAAKAIIKAHAPAHEAALAHTDVQAGDKANPAPRGTTTFGSHEVNSRIRALAVKEWFKRTAATDTETTFTRPDGASLTTQSFAYWTLALPGAEPVKGRGATALAEALAPTAVERAA